MEPEASQNFTSQEKELLEQIHLLGGRKIEDYIDGVSMLLEGLSITTIGAGVAVLGLRLFYEGQGLWLKHLILNHAQPFEVVTNHGVFNVESFKAFGILSQARLNLAREIFPFLDLLLKNIFINHENLWYWTEFGIARKRILNMGLLDKPPTNKDGKSKRIKAWADSLREREDETQSVEFYHYLQDLPKGLMLIKFLEELDQFMEGQAINLIKDGNAQFEDIYTNYLKKCRSVANAIRNDLEIQAGYLIDGEFYITSKNVRNPKPFA
jgi:hypothetical protein